ncbi:MAG: hypothetical protein J5J00_05710 [Deltaproteobacteria bacterium]|nr:hypothetical protein [Deltaproteobacteria bacterium]
MRLKVTHALASILNWMQDIFILALSGYVLLGLIYSVLPIVVIQTSNIRERDSFFSSLRRTTHLPAGEIVLETFARTVPALNKFKAEEYAIVELLNESLEGHSALTFHLTANILTFSVLGFLCGQRRLVLGAFPLPLILAYPTTALIYSPIYSTLYYKGFDIRIILAAQFVLMFMGAMIGSISHGQVKRL